MSLSARKLEFMVEKVQSKRRKQHLERARGDVHIKGQRFETEK
jgi:hypothetical protein